MNLKPFLENNSKNKGKSSNFILLFFLAWYKMKPIKDKKMREEMKNYYEILEVHPKASKEVIDKAYKVLVKRYHPDLYGGESLESSNTNQRIREINEAYHVLSNDFLREQYDLEIQKEKVKLAENKKTPSNSKKKPEKKENLKKRREKYKVGSFLGLVDLTKEIFKNRPKGEKKAVTKIDIIAVILTIMATIILGIILWFIPFTNGWMRELLFENPLFNWIGGLFS